VSNQVAVKTNHEAVESALVRNDISKLNTQERISYINALCESVGLNPMTKPFAFLSLQGREVVYATKDCAEQLRKIHGVSTQIVSQGIVGDCFEVHIKAIDKTGRTDEDFAVIPINNSKGGDLANLKMKTITKAKRRVTLSICGLGILDESELDTIKQSLKSPASNPQMVTSIQEMRKKDEPVLIEKKAEEFYGEVDLGEYVIQVGKKHKDKKLKDMDIFELDGYVKWVRSEAEKKGNGYGQFEDFMSHAEEYLKQREFGKEQVQDKIN
jgi:hypothetical protein